MQNYNQKLHSLTSLRFLAAFLIILSHLDGLFGFPPSFSKSYPFHYSVSFFFILSGFILAYSYPQLDSSSAQKKFLIARLARIWPVHSLLFFIVCLLSGAGLMENEGETLSSFLNLFLMQAWVPSASTFFSYNAPSWSLSVEFFFYLCFPWLIHQLHKTWLFKGMAIFSCPFLMIIFCAYFQLPNYSLTYLGITNYGFLYIHPLIRLPEFFIGILGAFFLQKYKWLANFNLKKATFIESLALSLVALNLYFYSFIKQAFLRLIPFSLAHEAEIWLSSTGILTCFSFLFVILVFSLQQGLISKLLSFRLMVVLGEMSFSMYLIHQVLNRFYSYSIGDFEKISNKLKFGGYLSILLFFSYLLWKYIEHPLRNWLVKTSSYSSIKFNFNPKD